MYVCLQRHLNVLLDSYRLDGSADAHAIVLLLVDVLSLASSQPLWPARVSSAPSSIFKTTRAAMSHAWKIFDFVSELRHLSELAKLRPGSMVVTTMVNTFVERIRAAKHWTSAAIIELLGEVQSMELPEPIKVGIWA